MVNVYDVTLGLEIRSNVCEIMLTYSAGQLGLRRFDYMTTCWISHLKNSNKNTKMQDIVCKS